jgi:hypothetical protein
MVQEDDGGIEEEEVSHGGLNPGLIGANAD